MPSGYVHGYGRHESARPQDQAATLDRGNVQIHQADLYAPPFAPESFDHVFVCFVLEHLADPVGALAEFEMHARGAISRTREGVLPIAE
jgi:hypothetical protein